MMYPKILLNEMMDGEDSVFRVYLITDYILVKAENFEKALKVLSDAGYDVV